MARPSVYNESYCDELIEKMSEGMFDYEVYADWNISKATFYQWKKQYPDFSEAYEIGYAKCEKWWATKGREKFCASDDKGHKYWNSVMKYKFKWEEDNIKGNVTINQTNIVNEYSNKELIDQIKTKLKVLKVIDVKAENLTESLLIEQKQGE